MSMTGTWGTGGVRCKVKDGWDGAGREGEALCYVRADRKGAQTWIVVIWEDEDEPETFKAAGLLFKKLGERTFKEERFS